MDKKPLFRTESLQANLPPFEGRIILIRPISFTVLTSVAVLLASSIVAFLAFGTYTKRSTIAGQVVSSLGQINIYPPQNGHILESHVNEGMLVTRKQPLLTLSSERYNSAFDPIQAGISATLTKQKISLNAQIARQRLLNVDEETSVSINITSIGQQIKSLSKQIESQVNLIAIAKDAETRYRGLVNKNYISRDLFQLRQAELLSQGQVLQSLIRERDRLQQKMLDSRNELSGLPVKHQTLLSNIEQTILNIDQQISESEARRLLVITAPESGVATTVLVEPGQTVGGSRLLLSIVPTGSVLRAELYAPSKAMGFVKPGDAVFIRYQAFPYQKFGQHRGVVNSISQISIHPSELANMAGSVPMPGLTGEQFYRIQVDLDNPHILAYGEKRSLRLGMLLEADILHETRHLYEWVLEPLYSLTGRL